MGKKIKNQPLAGKKIPVKALTLPDQERNDYPVFSFIHVSEQHCLLSEWQGEELLQLIRALKTMEQLRWTNVGSHGGLRFKPIDNYAKPLPFNVSPEVTVCEFRVCEVKRVFGYRVGNVFRILWFDREHEVCPWHKVRRV